MANMPIFGNHATKRGGSLTPGVDSYIVPGVTLKTPSLCFSCVKSRKETSSGGFVQDIIPFYGYPNGQLKIKIVAQI